MAWVTRVWFRVRALASFGEPPTLAEFMLVRTQRDTLLDRVEDLELKVRAKEAERIAALKEVSVWQAAVETVYQRYVKLTAVEVHDQEAAIRGARAFKAGDHPPK